MCDIENEGGSHSALNSDNNAGTVGEQRIVLSRDTLENIVVGTTGRASAIVYSNGDVDKSVTFHSTDASILSCTPDGEYTAIAVGTASIVATAPDGELTAALVFNVKELPEAITVVSTYIILNTEDSYYLAATVKPSGASQKVRYESFDSSIAKVNSRGGIVAVNYGKTTVRITAEDNADIYTDITVCVSEYDCNYDELDSAICVEAIELDCDTTTLVVGDTGSVSVNITPEDATYKTVSFKSSDTSVLTCTPYTGEFVAKAPGTAKIIATASSGVTSNISFTVNAKPKAITTKNESIYLEHGCSFELHPIVFPSTASQNCMFYSEDPTVAEVEEDGIIVAKKPGCTTVVISSADNHKLQKRITVCVCGVSCLCDDCAESIDPVVSVDEPIEKALNVQNDASVAAYPIGPNATAFVDIRTGILKFDVVDFAGECSATPINIHHLYTSALNHTNFSDGNIYGIKLNDNIKMRMGYGWRHNYMLSLGKYDTEDVYTFVDIEGNVYRLYSTEDTGIYKDKTDAGVIYYVEKSYVEAKKYRYYNLDNTWYIYDSSTEKTIGEYAEIKVITDASSDNLIQYVTDKSCRSFEFAYCSKNKLNYIEASGGNRVEYDYDGEFLKKITHSSGVYLYFEYDSNNRISKVSLENADHECEYMLSFLYDTNDRISKVTEYGRGLVEGISVDYSYDDNVTKLTTVENRDTEEETTTISTYLFGFSGNLIDYYTNHYRCQNRNNKKNNYCTTSNGPTISYERIPGNLLLGHGFDCEEAINQWTVSDNVCNAQICYDADDVVHGKGYLNIITKNNTIFYGCQVSQSIIRIPAGEYTFSAYVKKKAGQANSGIRLQIKAVDGSGTESVRITDAGMGYVQLFTTFENKIEQKVTVSINVFGDGEYCIDSAQLEVGSSVSEYNILENGNFMHYVYAWDEARKSTAYVVYDDIMYSLNGRMTVRKKNTGENMPCQIVRVKSHKNTRTTYTLSGFAKLKSVTSVPNDNLKFRLCANIVYVRDGAEEEPRCEQYIADFSQETNEWQYATVTFTKSRFQAIDHIEIACEYYDSSMENEDIEYAYFESVALTVGETECNLSEEDFSTSGLQIVNYNNIGDYRSIVKNDSIGEYGIDFCAPNCEDVLKALCFLVTHNVGDIGIEKTLSINKNDRNVSCSYDDMNNLKTVVYDDGTTYVYSYNEFHKLERIIVNGRLKPLVKYKYRKNNGTLKSATFADGRHVEYTYDRFCRRVRAVYYDVNGNIRSDIKYTYDGAGRLIGIFDIMRRTEHTYLYEHGNLVCEMQSVSAFVDEKGFKTAGILSYISYNSN